MPHLMRKGVALLAIAFLGAMPGAGFAEDATTMELGRQVFTTEAAPQCGICHSLSAAETTGAIGPDLDDLKPTEDQVRTAVSGGVGVMPAYSETLSQDEIDAVAHYVATVVGQAQ